MFIPSILDGLLFFYSIWAPSMLVILFASVFLKKHYWQAGLVSMISGILTSVMWNILKYNELFPTILIGLIISFVSYFITYQIFKYRRSILIERKADENYI
jgi:Na+/pantothenate symporter